MKTAIDKKPGCQALVTGVLSTADIQKELPATVKRLVKSVELPGFRKGKAPEERVRAEVGEKAIWQDAAEEVLREALPEIIKEHALFPILPPSVTLNVTTPDADVPFELAVTTRPTIEITNYKKTAEGAVDKLEKLDPEKQLAEARASILGQAASMVQKPEGEEFADDDAKKLGFENAKALTFFLNSEAERAVENFEQQRKRGAVAEALLAKSTHDIPAVLIREEAGAMLDTMKQDIARQMPFNEYLEKRGMTESQVVDELLPQAEKRVALDMIFAKIAEEEKLTPDDAETHRIAHALMHQGAPADRAHAYAAEMSIREKIWVVLGVTPPPAPAVTPEAVEPEPIDTTKPNGHTHPHE